MGCPGGDLPAVGGEFAGDRDGDDPAWFAAGVFELAPAGQRGKSDTLDSERIARETLAHPLLPKAFKRAGQDAGPDQQTELMAVWWTARCSVIKRRQHLLTESEALLRELPLELVERLPRAKRVRPRLAALPHSPPAGASLPRRPRGCAS